MAIGFRNASHIQGASYLAYTLHYVLALSVLPTPFHFTPLGSARLDLTSRLEASGDDRRWRVGGSTKLGVLSGLEDVKAVVGQRVA